MIFLKNFISCFILTLLPCSSLLSLEYIGIIDENNSKNIKELQEEVSEIEGYISVKLENLLLIRFPDGLRVEEDKLKTIQLLNLSNNTASQYIKENHLLYSISKRVRNQEDYDGVENFTNGENNFNSSCIVDEESIKPSVNKNNVVFDLDDPDKTSEIMTGSSVAAVFFVHNVNHQSMGVPAWDDPKQNDVLANIAVNLDWWSKQAAGFDVEKTFEVKVFGWDASVSQVTFDPTEGYIGYSDKDHVFQNTIMENLGYTEGNHRDKMRKFAHETRLEEGSDWAFCAFIIEGANHIRAHASFNGPSTVLSRGSARSGYTFAHEVGHIYGAFDEYWEDGRYFRAKQERFGAVNGNFHWRNYPVQPSMMASSYSGGISYYTAVHLGLADEVRYTTVKPVPENAVYEVTYIDEQGRETIPEKYQGSVDFHWGNGMKIKLNAIEYAISDNYEFWLDPKWEINDDSSYTFEMTDDTDKQFNLNLSNTGIKSDYKFEYLHYGNALASNDIQTISITDKYIGFGGKKGISAYNGKNKYILDFEPPDQRSAYPRASTGSYVGEDEILYFSTEEGEVLKWENEELSGYLSEDLNLPLGNIAVVNENKIYAMTSPDGGREDSISPNGLHVFENGEYVNLTTENSNIPSDYVSDLEVSFDNKLWVSFQGRNDAESGLYLYDTDNNKWQNFSDNLNYKRVSKIRVKGSEVQVFTDNGLSIIKDQGVVNIKPDIMDRDDYGSRMRINDFYLSGNGMVLYSTSMGVFRYDENNEFLDSLNSENSYLPSDMVYTFEALNEQILIFGTSNGGVIFYDSILVTNVDRELTEESSLLTYGCHPNPIVNDCAVVFKNKYSGNIRFQLFDIEGRVIINKQEFYTAGLNEFPLKAQDLPNNHSVYFYTISDGKNKISGKILK